VPQCVACAVFIAVGDAGMSHQEGLDLGPHCRKA